jgi:hypothetical protein
MKTLKQFLIDIGKFFGDISEQKNVFLVPGFCCLAILRTTSSLTGHYVTGDISSCFCEPQAKILIDRGISMQMSTLCMDQLCHIYFQKMSKKHRFDSREQVNFTQAISA